MNLATCFCRNRHCAYYGLVGKASRLQLDGWHGTEYHFHGAQHLQCAACGHHLSARSGTGYADSRTPETVFQDGVRQLAEGAAIRATGRNIDCDKDTVAHWLRVVGPHCLRILKYFFRHLHLSECQLDSLKTTLNSGHSFTKRKPNSRPLKSWPDSIV